MRFRASNLDIALQGLTFLFAHRWVPLICLHLWQSGRLSVETRCEYLGDLISLVFYSATEHECVPQEHSSRYSICKEVETTNISPWQGEHYGRVRSASTNFGLIASVTRRHGKARAAFAMPGIFSLLQFELICVCGYRSRTHWSTLFSKAVPDWKEVVGSGIGNWRRRANNIITCMATHAKLTARIFHNASAISGDKVQQTHTTMLRQEKKRKRQEILTFDLEELRLQSMFKVAENHYQAIDADSPTFVTNVDNQCLAETLAGGWEVNEKVQRPQIQ